jgi:hypothetical protein
MTEKDKCPNCGSVWNENLLREYIDSTWDLDMQTVRYLANPESSGWNAKMLPLYLVDRCFPNMQIVRYLAKCSNETK